MAAQSNYFTLFDLPEAFVLDPAALERQYFTLQRQYHPDRFAAKGAAERAEATSASMRINDAYAVLRNPLRRAQYLLGLKGIRVGGEKDTVKPSPALLMEVMELREKQESGAEIAAEVTRGVEECEKTLEAAFAAGKPEEAAQLTLRLGYLKKLAEELRVTQ